MLDEWAHLIPDDVVTSFNEGPLPVIFLGSGFAKESLPPLKTGGELAVDLRTELRIDDGGEGLAELLQYYKNSMSRNDRAVVTWLRRKLLDGESKPGGAYRLLLELPCKEFLTTNYDSLLSDASRELKGYYLTPVDDPTSYKELRANLHNENGRPILGRLHGAFESQTRIVATTDDYIRNYTREQQWREILQDIISNDRVIFIGYSMRDFTTWTSYISMYVRWDGNRYPHVMVGPSSSDHVISFWNNYGVKFVPLTAAQFLIGVHSRIKTLETKETVLFAAAAARLGKTYTETLEELERRKERHKYPNLKLTAMKAVLEDSDATI
ncbi:MAG TPA: SIR2 family protein [Pyrinomonadaceae bacterium]|nr:SIR2 family protein [Pyrinomonadaceae bacterium]